MRVGFVIDMDYPHVGEVRPRKLAQSLHRAGHECVFLCKNSRTKDTTETLDYGVVHRFDWFLNSRLFGIFSATSPLSPIWALWIRKMVREERLDILVTSNIRLAIPAIVAARTLGIPVVVDLQENNAEVVRLRPKTKVTHYLSRNGHLVGLLESLCVARADHTWVVVEERIGALPARLRAPEKVSVVCHTPDESEINVGVKSFETHKRDFSLAYVGLFAPGHGSVELLMRSLPVILRQDPNVRIAVAGGRQLEPLATELGILDHVDFAGLIPADQVCSWLKEQDVGVIAYDPSRFTDTTVSNKLFYYMAVGIPVLSTDMAPTRRIVEEVGCGRIIPRNATPEDLSRIVLEMKNSPEECAAMGRRGRQAILDKYNWQRDFKHALDTLSGLVGRHSAASVSAASGAGAR